MKPSNPRGPASLDEVILVVGVPLVLAVVEVFHPHPHDLLNVDVQTWMAIHYAQIPLFPLSALAVIALVRGRSDAAAIISRVAMFVFAVSYVAFDTAAGVVTVFSCSPPMRQGRPRRGGHRSRRFWTHPIMGGSSSGPPPILAVLGSVALSVGAVAAAVSLKRAGCSWPPAILLALSSFGIAIFATHAWPGGPLTFGGLAVAGGWLLGERGRAYAAG
jgi:hypothetical protein